MFLGGGYKTKVNILNASTEIRNSFHLEVFLFHLEVKYEKNSTFDHI